MQRVSYTPPGNKTSEELINFGKNVSPFFTRISETLGTDVAMSSASWMTKKSKKKMTRRRKKEKTKRKR